MVATLSWNPDGEREVVVIGEMKLLPCEGKVDAYHAIQQANSAVFHALAKRLRFKAL